MCIRDRYMGDRIQQAEKNSSQPKKKVKQEPQIIINQIHPQWVQTEVNQSNAQDNQSQQQENHLSSLKQTDPDNYNEENQDFVINKMEITNSMASTPQFLQTFEVEVRDENALPGESFVQKEKKSKKNKKAKKSKNNQINKKKLMQKRKRNQDDMLEISGRILVQKNGLIMIIDYLLEILVTKLAMKPWPMLSGSISHLKWQRLSENAEA
eukprot:TRINITY_DN11270_c0_g1_i3.p2 TRINITY_DN11270_c0_g1~~TRINITY_DN11270_c0_g1_i3.p2  ORF type:complete len:210 (+),score=36.29 TRINITY_DN11270_c0_g1_i3:88-717(+)